LSWGFKDFQAITSPGTDFFVVLDNSTPEGIRAHALRDDYGLAQELSLPDQVPQSVRDYFDGTRMLWLHGWFYYPFYSMAAVHSYLCMELALKERFRIESVSLHSFAGMLDYAIKKNWFAPVGFGRFQRRVEHETRYSQMDADDPETSMPASVERDAALHAEMVRLLENIRSFRNAAAHPDGLTLWLPNMTYGQIEFTRDAIVQLFSDDTR
jgi:hypothetical protein